MILYFGNDDDDVREASLSEEHPFSEEDVHPPLGRIDDDGEIERFAGYHRARTTPEASP
jgi:hypothetical protein